VFLKKKKNNNKLLKEKKNNHLFYWFFFFPFAFFMKKLLSKLSIFIFYFSWYLSNLDDPHLPNLISSITYIRSGIFFYYFYFLFFYKNKIFYQISISKNYTLLIISTGSIYYLSLIILLNYPISISTLSYIYHFRSKSKSFYEIVDLNRLYVSFNIIANVFTSSIKNSCYKNYNYASSYYFYIINRN